MTPNKNIIDGSKINASATTVINKQTKKSQTTASTVNNKRKIIVHYFDTEYHSNIAKDQTVELGYGKKYKLSPFNEKPTGYTYNRKLDKSTAGTVSDKTTEATFYYDANPYFINVHYMLEDGQLLDNLQIIGLYGDTYTSEATDYDDLYTLVTEKLPNNINGDVTEKPINVNYYYRPTTGKWVDIGNGSTVLARKDYKNNIRSVNQVFMNGTAYTIKYDMNASQVAIIADNNKYPNQAVNKVFKYGSSYTYKLKNEQVKFDIDKSGKVTVTRAVGNESTVTKFDRTGIITNTVKVTNNDKTYSQQSDIIDGKNSVITKEDFKQTTKDGYEVTGNRDINLHAKTKKVNRQKETVPATQQASELNFEKVEDVIEDQPVSNNSIKAVALTTKVSEEPTENSEAVKDEDIDDSFNEGEPLTTPGLDNEPDDYQTPAEASNATNIKVVKNGKVKIGTAFIP